MSERSSLAPRPRGARARSIARDVDAKSLVDMVADFDVKATGKDGVQMRQQLANMKPVAVSRVVAKASRGGCSASKTKRRTSRGSLSTE